MKYRDTIETEFEAIFCTVNLFLSTTLIRYLSRYTHEPPAIKVYYNLTPILAY